jgi:hypothetical protein
MCALDHNAVAAAKAVARWESDPLGGWIPPHAGLHSLKIP